ncbi:MAG: hypothetical protein ABI574_07340 [Burkholderiales bacterium]
MSQATAFVNIGDLRKGRQVLSEVIETPETGGGCGTSGGKGKADDL